MSQKSAKKERRDRLRQAEEPENRARDSVSEQVGMSGMLRRKAATYALAATLAVGGLAFGSYEVSSHQTRAQKYDLELVFLTHGSERDAFKFLSEFNEAQKKGKPANVLFFEDAAQVRSNYDEFVVDLNKKFSGLRKDYLDMLSKGKTPEQAEEACRREITIMGRNNSGSDRFLSIVLAHCAVMGVKVLPIEARTSEEVKRSYELMTRTKNQYDELSNLYKKNATLKELMLLQRDIWKSSVDEVRTRNDEISTNMTKRFDEAVRIFPELAKEQELRAIGFIGSMHSPLCYSIKQDDPSLIKYDLRKFPADEYISPLSTRITAQMREPRELTKREAYLVALEERIIQRMASQVGKSNPGLVKELEDKAFDLTEGKLDDINEKSSKIEDVQQRWTFILNQIVGREEFR